MALSEILSTILIISLFCAGLSLISREGYLLYFLRKPFEAIHDKYLNWQARLKSSRKTTGGLWEKPESEIYCLTFWLLDFLSKPIILCCTCMASVWGTAIFLLLHGLKWELIICCIAAAFLNTLFVNLIEKLES